MEDIIRKLEKINYFGYLFFVEYDGLQFEGFDKDKNFRTVKGEFEKTLYNNDIYLKKGIQQAGRTDKYVSAKENILFINSNKELENYDLETFKTNGFRVNKIIKTIPYLDVPNIILERKYIYKYPNHLVKNKEEEILKRCNILSGKQDFSRFTTKKGRSIKNQYREIYINYKNEILTFVGDSFLPQQVRIMSSYILNNEFTALEGQYLCLDSLKLKDEFSKFVIEKVNDIQIENVIKIEKGFDFYIFYVKNKDKGMFIGEKGKNIKSLRKIYGNIIVKTI